MVENGLGVIHAGDKTEAAGQNNARASVALTILSTVLGLVVAVLACLWLYLQKARYAVRICTAAREFQAYVTVDSQEADDIADAVDKAISARG